MALRLITTTHQGQQYYVETDVPGYPTDMTPRIGAICTVMINANVMVYEKMSATAWEQVLTTTSSGSGNLGVPLVLPVTLTAAPAGGTQTFSLPARPLGWRVMGFHGVNTSGGPGGGSVKLQVATGVVDITEAMIPGAANDTFQNTVLVYTAIIASGGVLNFVKTAGFTAAQGWVDIEAM